MNSKSRDLLNSCIKIFVISFFIFLMVTSFVGLTPIFEDWSWIRKTLVGTINIYDFNWLIPKRPLSSLLSFWAYKNGHAEGLYIPSIIGFSLHAVGWFLCAKYMLECFFPKIKLDLKSKTVLALATLFIWGPNNFENIYDPVPNVFFVTGLFFTGLATLTRKPVYQYLLLATSFFFFEIFAIPALLIPLADSFFKGQLLKNKFKRQQITYLITWILAMITFWVVFYYLREFFQFRESYPSSLEKLAKVPGQLKLSFKFIWMLHFYKDFWFPSLIFWIGMGFMFYVLFQSKNMDFKKFVFWNLLPVLSAPYFLVYHYAPRAFGGGITVWHMTLFCFCIVALKQKKFKKQTYTAITCIVFSFIYHTGTILKYKGYNSRIMSTEQAIWIDKMKKCKEPCVLSIKGVGKSFERDWVVITWGRRDFLEVTRIRAGIEKPISYVE